MFFLLLLFVSSVHTTQNRTQNKADTQSATDPLSVTEANLESWTSSKSDTNLSTSVYPMTTSISKKLDLPPSHSANPRSFTTVSSTEPDIPIFTSPSSSVPSNISVPSSERQHFSPADTTVFTDTTEEHKDNKGKIYI